MSKIEMILFIIAVAVSIVYLIFMLWNVFITKRQITLSLIDFIFWETAAVFGCLRTYDEYGIKGVIAVIILVILGESLIAYRCHKNKKDKRGG